MIGNNSSAISVSHWKRYLSRLPMVQGSKCRNEKWEIRSHIWTKRMRLWSEIIALLSVSLIENVTCPNCLWFKEVNVGIKSGKNSHIRTKWLRLWLEIIALLSVSLIENVTCPDYLWFKEVSVGTKSGKYAVV